MFGEAPIGRIIRRGGAREGDRIFVTGTIGDAALGLRVLSGSLTGLDSRAAAYLADRCQLPQPRVILGPQLLDIASSSVDVSDGLVADLGHICAVSHLCAVVEETAVPLSTAAIAAIRDVPECLALALTGGDDYEVVFTAPPAATPRVEALSRTLGIPITPIGRMTAACGVEHSRVHVLDSSGQPISFESEGWTHFGDGC